MTDDYTKVLDDDFASDIQTIGDRIEDGEWVNYLDMQCFYESMAGLTHTILGDSKSGYIAVIATHRNHLHLEVFEYEQRDDGDWVRKELKMKPGLDVSEVRDVVTLLRKWLQERKRAMIEDLHKSLGLRQSTDDETRDDTGPGYIE